MKNIAFLILCFIVFAFNVALSKNIYFLSFLPVLLLLIYKFKNLKTIFKRVFFLNLFIVAISLSLLYYGDYKNAILIFIRSNLIILFMLTAFYDVDEFKLASAISNLGLGAKFSSLFYFTAKFIYMIKEIFLRLKKTLKSRGFKAKFSLFSYRIYGNLVAMLLLNAFYKIDIFEKTLTARGYNGNLYKFKKEFKLDITELLLGFSVVLTLFIKKGILV